MPAFRELGPDLPKPRHDYHQHGKDERFRATADHNVKIISQNGIVTLKGPVRFQRLESITSKTTASAGGSDRVVNQLSVKP